MHVTLRGGREATQHVFRRKQDILKQQGPLRKAMVALTSGAIPLGTQYVSIANRARACSCNPDGNATTNKNKAARQGVALPSGDKLDIISAC